MRFDQIQSDAEFAGKNNLTATVAPTATDDSASGYEVGSVWVDTTADKAYICLDATATSAVWTETTGGGGGATLFNDLTDVNQGFVSASGTIVDDGKIPFYDFATKQFITDESVTHGTVTINAKTSVATSTIAKGLAVYVDDFNSDIVVVELADSDGASTYPAIGITAEALNSTDGKHVITFGKITGLDTQTTVANPLNPNGETWLVGQSLYLSKTAGGLTNVRPTGATEIQRIAKVLKVDTLGGQLFIFNTGRTAGLPNLTTDYIWQGDINSHPQEVYPWVPPMTDVSSGTAGQSAALVSVPLGTGIGHYRNYAGTADDSWSTIVPLYNNGLSYDGRNIVIDLHWMPFGAVGTDQVEWTIEYYFGRDGIDVFTQTPTTVTTIVVITGRTSQLQYTDTVATISGTAGDTQLHINVRRNAGGSNPNDTYNGAAELYSITFR